MSDTSRTSVRAGAVVRIVIWVMVLCLLVGVFTFCFIKKPWNEWGVFSFSGFGGYHYDDTGYSIGDATITDRVSSLDVDWIAGQVEIVAYDGEQLTLKETVTESHNDDDNDDQLRWQVKNGKLTVKHCKPYVGWNDVPVKTLTVQVPAAWLTDEVVIDTASANVKMEGFTSGMKELDVDTASGRITLTDVYATDMDVDTASGTVETKGIRVNEADFDSASGSVTVQGMVEELEIDTASGKVTVDVTGLSSGESQTATDAHKVTVDTASGSITFVGRVQELELGTASGRMDITLTAPARTVSLDTASGDVTLRLPDDIPGFTVDIDSASGDLSVNGFATEGGNRHKTYGNGSTKIDVDSASGDIFVEKIPSTTPETN